MLTIIILLLVAVSLTGCGVPEEEHNAIVNELKQQVNHYSNGKVPMDNTEGDTQRFISTDYNKTSFKVIRVITDTSTGNQYLFVREGNSAGLTRLTE
jgi:hypothetical protein